MLCLYIKYKLYTCAYFQNIDYMCVCVYLYIHNKYTQHTHILCKQKLILDVINHLTALIKTT